MNELHFAYKLRQYLNRGLHELPPTTLDRLASARRQAIARQKVVVRRSALATAGDFVQHQVEGLHLRQVLLALLLALGVATYTYWSADESIAEIEAIDSARANALMAELGAKVAGLTGQTLAGRTVARGDDRSAFRQGEIDRMLAVGCRVGGSWSVAALRDERAAAILEGQAINGAGIMFGIETAEAV